MNEFYKLQNECRNKVLSSSIGTLAKPEDTKEFEQKNKKTTVENIALAELILKHIRNIHGKMRNQTRKTER